MNGNGTGPASAASNSVTPLAASAPAAPTAVSGDPGDRQAQVSWTAPAANGSPITCYTVTPYIGTTAQTPTQVSNGSATSATVTGLTTGTAYTFTVSATNAVGTGSASAASAAVTPEDTILDFGTPATVDSGETTGTTLGVAFTADSNGKVMGIRFYKAATNTGTHVGACGALPEPSWPRPTSRARAHPDGRRCSSPLRSRSPRARRTSPATSRPTATTRSRRRRSTLARQPAVARSGHGTSPNGVYTYGAASAFPTSTFNASNYWVDVLFAPTP